MISFYFSGHKKATGDDWRRGDRNGYGEAEDRTSPSSDLFCANCGPRSSGKTAKLVVMTPQWNYYYCYLCRGWFQGYFKFTRLTQIHDKRLEKALSWYSTSGYELTAEERKVLEWFHSLWRRFRDYYYSLITQPSRS